MKRILPLIYSVVAILCLYGCQKDGIPLDEKKAHDVPGEHLVTTIAGNGNGFEEDIDGVGKAASFAQPIGIGVTSKNVIYVACINGNSIRKIVQDSIVNTVSFSPSSFELYAPQELVVATDGTITFTSKTYIQEAGLVVSYKPGSGQAPLVRGDDVYTGLTVDPQENMIWACAGQVFSQNFQFFKVEPYKKTVNFVLIPIDKVSPNARFSNIVALRNDVKYVVANGSTLYKYEEGGHLAPTLTNLTFTSITSMIATKDSKTIYMVDDYKIKKLDVATGTVETLAGPNGSGSNEDGVGLAADVSAIRIALSADEKFIYFTNLNYLIRKIAL
ncbi:hypothetical protein IM792_15645 [Mucilaginibacter sp. JRF]|uniref:hypothetical protein n=1 Tax=Mucilaginibacter sp. JRF TaxID=2780088 RepID=UPI00187E7F16|nr:hypothetical protein [Mucilaginibacter sp. JRF]MBE9585890.1 hypothetical protein [Mucilaginibacter sp. JRF]